MPTKKNKQSRLGRGLSSLMATPVEVQSRAAAPSQDTTHNEQNSQSTPSQSDETPTAAPEQPGLSHLPVELLQRNRHQPRQKFDPTAIKSLAESIQKDGLMQPIVVRPLPEDNHRYEIIAGERRWRAAQEAGIKAVPALVREMGDEKSAEWALIENLQREDLNAIEKAEAFQHLANKFGLSNTEIGERVGLERSTVSNLLRLLDLSDFVRDLLREEMLSMGQARAIAGIKNGDHQRALAERAVREGLSVRQVEAEVKRLLELNTKHADSAIPAAVSSPALTDLEKQIGTQLGTKVKIKTSRKKGAGTLSIDFYSLDQFDALLARMDVQPEQ